MNAKQGSLLLVLIIAATAALRADVAFKPAELVRDLNVRPGEDLVVDVLCKRGDVVYFKANDQVHGFELWRTDGTAGGTFLLKDAGPGMEHSGFDYDCFGSAPDGTTYLRIFNRFGSWELWRSDGTPAGTYPFVEPSTDGDALSHYFVGFIGNSVLYVPNEGSASEELWISDGTAAGTRRVETFTGSLRGPTEINLSYTYAGGPRVLFGTQQGLSGALWITDGTTAGTHALGNIRSGINGYYDFAQAGNYVLFRSANSQQWGDDLWRTDGTPAGTIQLTSPPAPGVSSVLEASPVSLGGRAVFALRVNDTTVTLWSTDGTPQNTQPIHGPAGDLRPDTVWDWHVLGNRVLVTATTAAAGRELWSTDGTEAGTALLANLAAGTANGDPYALFGPQEAPYEAFFAYSETRDKKLWVTDGTPAGTHFLRDLPQASTPGDDVDFASHGASGYLLTRYVPSLGSTAKSYQLSRLDFATRQLTVLREFETDPSAFTGASLMEMAGNKPVFVTRETGQGQEFWASDGTAGGTVRVSDIVRPVTNLGSDPRFLASAGGVAYFSAMNSHLITSTTPTYTLWRTDGTSAGTVEMFEMQPMDEAVVLPGNKVVFPGYYHAYGIEPWITDSMGTRVIKDINPGQAFSMRDTCTGVRWLAMNDRVYFPAFDASGGRELWRSDGTEAGTQRVADVAAGAGSSNPCSFAVFNGRLYFAATVDGDRELWRTDGTAGGTQRVADIRAGASSDPTELTAAGTVLYFVATGAGGRRELWRSDGSSDGTARVADVSADPAHANSIAGLIALDTRLFFTACSDGGSPGCHLWTSDGTASGTVSLAASSAAVIFGLRALGKVSGKLLFAGNDGVSGEELWISDGTAGGTRLLMDLNPAADGSPVDFTDFNGLTYFRAATGAGVTQLWRTDGTAAGTIRVAERSTGQPPGIAAQNAWRPGVLGQSLLFPADDGLTGLEPWKQDNLQPTAAADSASTTSPNAVTVNVTSNDSDADGAISAGSVRITTQPVSGTVQVTAETGAVRYTPNSGFSGSDSFAYVVADNQRFESAPATVTITVAAAPNSGSNNGGGGGGGGGPLGVLEIGLLLLCAGRRYSVIR